MYLSYYSVVNTHSIITNRVLGQIGHFSKKINPVVTNPNYNEQKMVLIIEFKCKFIIQLYLKLQLTFVWNNISRRTKKKLEARKTEMCR